MKLDAEQRHALLASPAGWIASGFGAGFSPFAPGTAGSLAAFIPWLFLRGLPWPFYFALVAIAFAIGVWASNVIVATLRIEDPGVIVWDEFVGQWIALMPLLWGGSRDWYGPIAAFVLFRLFDIWKPWPVSWADRRIDGGLGVMLDDVLAGFYAAILLAIAIHLWR